MDGDPAREVDRLVEALYADAFDAEWSAFGARALRRFCEWLGADAAAWRIQVRDGGPGEFACWPAAFADAVPAFETLGLGPGRRTRRLSRAAGDAFDGLALALDHRGSHLRSVLLLQGVPEGWEESRLRRAGGHLVQAATLALRQFVRRDEWLMNLGRASRGSAALVDARGAVYAISERFRDLVALEFGEREFAVLPFALPAERLEEAGAFSVGSLHFRIKPEGALYLINARRPHPLDVLSPREQEIARALALGKTFKSVARECEIAISTVANHASRIYRKLGIYRREELVELLRRAVDSKAA